MKVKFGTILIAAVFVLSLGTTIVNAADPKSSLAGLSNVITFSKDIPEQIQKAGLSQKVINDELDRKVNSLGISRFNLSRYTELPISDIEAKFWVDEASQNKFSICCSLSLKTKIPVVARKLDLITWQKNNFAVCDSAQIGEAAKKCLTVCLDAFGKDYEAANPKNTGGQNMLTGKIQRVNLEGGFFGIVGDDGQKYDPVNLKDEFKKDGLPVKFTVKEKTGAVSFRMWGKIVEIISMEIAEKKAESPVTLQWFGHASFKICLGNQAVYIDPWKLKEDDNDATVALVSHSHSDHYSPVDLKKVSKPDTKLFAPDDVVRKEGKGTAMKPGETVDVNGIKITGIPAYNPAKQFHPKANNWLGFIIEIGGVRIYYAGDTDVIGEMSTLKNIDVALVPIGGNFTMNADEAAQAVKIIKPKEAIPYHFGDIVGKPADARRFAQLVDCDVFLLNPGDIVALNE